MYDHCESLHLNRLRRDDGVFSIGWPALGARLRLWTTTLDYASGLRLWITPLAARAVRRGLLCSLHLRLARTAGGGRACAFLGKRFARSAVVEKAQDGWHGPRGGLGVASIGAFDKLQWQALAA